MKWLISFLFIVIISSCDNDDKKYKITEKLSENFYIIEIDSCEYIISRGNREKGITHKGNCKNTIHKIYKHL